MKESLSIYAKMEQPYEQALIGKALECIEEADRLRAQNPNNPEIARLDGLLEKLDEALRVVKSGIINREELGRVLGNDLPEAM